MTTWDCSKLSELVAHLGCILHTEGEMKVEVDGVTSTSTVPEVLVKIRYDGTKYIEISGREP